jgi:hypothetical protein
MAVRKDAVLTNFILTQEDREVLNTIAEQDGTNGMSGVIRRLIRDEGRRRGILPPIVADVPVAQPIKP